MKNEVEALLFSGDISLLKEIKQLDWRLENSTSEQIVAYQLAQGETALSKLKERLQKNKPGILLLNRDPGEELGCPLWIAKPGVWPKILDYLCHQFFPLPAGLRLLAVTGTNGKTTTADLVLQLGEAAGLRGFSIGTLGVRRKGETLEEFGLTTPGQIQLRQLLSHYGNKSDFAVVEASSHALDQERVYGLLFEAAAWTSFTQDHLDYHASMDEYFKAKEKIFNYIKPNGLVFAPAGQVELTQRLSSKNNFRVVPGFSTEQQKILPVFFRARFNEENLSSALALVGQLGVDTSKVAFAKLLPPPGRFYIREWDGRTAIVDFAHTPDALENILSAVKEAFPQHHLIGLFGCGGDRDRTKRPLMGQAVAKFCNEVVVTSDNPRTENPEQIIQDIVKGIGSAASLVIEVDRPTAVRSVLAKLRAGDVLVMAGKGHEDYILKGTTKVPYSDIAELDGYIARVKGKTP
jgi:UDP-N-acetylmuramoyl-L-alanyl-D-glutamate--2,6-diaminopimelate ligase